MNFEELVLKNRTCRRYDQSKKVEREELKYLVNLARLSASGANRQALRFVLVNDEKGCSDVFDNIFWAGYLKDWDGPAEGERPAAYIIMVSAENHAPMKEDVGIAAQSISLGARDRNMASCMFGAYREKAVKESLGIDDSYKIELIMSIGYPVETAEIVPVKASDSIKYYRDENMVHYVPKIDIDELILK